MEWLSWVIAQLKNGSPLFIFIKEFTGTFTALVCYSRIGVYNMLYSGGINVGMILLVFGFPFLNPYLVTFMYFGPFFDSNKIWTLVMEWVISVKAQVLGSICAGYFRKFLTSMYSTEGLSNSYGYVSLPATTNNAVWLVDEMFAVLFLLIGLLHLIRALASPILKNSVWNQSSSSSSAKTGPPLPLPIQLIMSVVFLVVAITHAFPSADQSFHVTMFLYFADFRTGDVWWHRFIGGIIGTITALVYYHCYYNNKDAFNVSNVNPTSSQQAGLDMKTQRLMEMKLPFFRRRV